MLYQPKFKNCFTVEIIKSVGVFLISESDSFVLSGHLYELLTPLINGHNTPSKSSPNCEVKPHRLKFTIP